MGEKCPKMREKWREMGVKWRFLGDFGWCNAKSVRKKRRKNKLKQGFL